MEGEQWSTRLRRMFAAWFGEDDTEEGQGLVEYALILVLVVLVAFVVLATLGPWIGNAFSNVVNVL